MSLGSNQNFSMDYTSGRNLVISDIHGCVKTLDALLKKVSIQKTDKLYFLGDYIDRGPDSPGVIDLILNLKEQGFLIFLLRGNHEQNILDAYTEYDKDFLVHFVARINKSQGLLNQDGSIKQKYFDFLNSLNDYYFELDNCFLVHAGFDFTKTNPFSDKNSMLEQRGTVPDKNFIGNKHIIHGHNVTYLENIIEAVNSKKQVIPLDNGCVYNRKHKIYDTTRTGNLCCLNTDTFELYLQPNIDVKE